MLFAVLSEPLPTRPSEAAANRRRYWEWARPLQEAGTMRHVWARAGRGALAVFEVDGNATLHRLLNEWAEIVPARFDVYPLLDPDAAQAFLARPL
ncbi:MAG: muconolactone Delta-isomerase family protein [Acetobacteraceae bacterium]